MFTVNSPVPLTSPVAYRKIMLFIFSFSTHSVRKNACLSRTFSAARKLQRNHFYAFPSLLHKNYNSSHAFYMISHHEA